MGTPFSGSPYANNAWRAYELVTGHSVEQPPVEVEIAVKPPVETVALWSPRDGIVAPRSACGLPGERDRAVALRCSHIGFASSDEAIAAVARELERADIPLTRGSPQAAPCGSAKRAIVHCVKQGTMSAPNPAQFDEMHAPDGSVRDAYTDYQRWLSEQDSGWMRRKGAEAESFFRRTGITFNVYGDDDAEERLIPFDMVPRIITGGEWRRLSRGIEQRVRALNAFMHDLYHRQEIIRSGRLPERLFRDNRAWLPEMVGFTPPGGVYTHIVGIDLVRTGPDEFLVLEDNARTPSGVSYMLENRETMMAMFPELFARVKVQPVSNYPRLLAKSLAACAPKGAATCRRSPCSRRGSTTRPISSTPSSPTRWAPSWSRAATCGWSTAGCRCAPRRASSRSTCSTAGSTTTSSIR